MSVTPLEAAGSDQPGPAEYTLVYTTVQGSIEEATVIADTFVVDGPYLIFGLDDQVVTALPHASVVQWGETEAAKKAFRPDNPDDDGAFLEFAKEAKDPWAHLSGKDSR